MGKGLDSRYLNHLKKLTEPIEDVPCRDRRRIPLRFSAYTRLIGGHFLLQTTWRYDRASDPSVPTTDFGSLDICPHQHLHWGLMTEPAYRLGWIPAKDETIDGAVLSALFDAPAGAAQQGSCPYCPLDFALQVWPDRVTLRAWWDLGTEGPPTDKAWQSLTAKLVRVNHKPGSVMEFFASGDGDANDDMAGPKVVSRGKAA
ncbi:hypothetical protein RJ55_02171 [Drechmeria coniospora]|nr:hypothetical protein RJ55_02171 [Drechmeria coniospora]